MPLAPTDKPLAAPAKETTSATFRADVLNASMQQPVLVDFWAPWCGPCKQLAPILERAVAATDGKVLLYKMNIDEHPQIASQLGVQSIPAVFAFDRGKPVDGFVGALPESQIVAFLERLIGPLGADETVLQAADDAIARGEAAEALAILTPLVQEDPEDLKAVALYLRALVADGRAEQASGLLAQLPESLRKDPRLAQAVAAIDLAAQAGDVGDTAALEQRLASNPNDHQSRFDLALALNAQGARAQAADQLLDIFKRERAWNDDGARKQLLQFFESWGPLDPATKGARRKLSSMLFS